MDAKTAVNYLVSGRTECLISERVITEHEIAEFIEQQANQINEMKNCNNCHYEDYMALELPCNICVHCFDEEGYKDMWELKRAELLEGEKQ